MVNSVNWLFDGFLLLFNLHVAFMLFYFWNVMGFHPYVMLYFLALFFCLRVVFLPRTFFLLCIVLLDVPQFHVLYLFFFFCALFLYLPFFPKLYQNCKTISKFACPTGPQHSHVARPEPLKPISCSSMPKGSFERQPLLPPPL
jgi:hypothetical protein